MQKLINHEMGYLCLSLLIFLFPNMFIHTFELQVTHCKLSIKKATHLPSNNIFLLPLNLHPLAIELALCVCVCAGHKTKKQN